MHRLLRAGILITFGMLIIGIIGGCGDDDPPRPRAVIPPSVVVTVVVDPAPPADPDSPIPTHTNFTLTFSEEVMKVTVNDIPAAGSGLNWKWGWNPPPDLPYGPLNLNIRWKNRDGSKGFSRVGPYRAADVNVDPPRLTSGTVADGAVDVEPAWVNAGVRFDFNEAVTGTIRLTDEAGVDLKWTSNVGGQTATMTPVAGQEVVNETTYKIEIDVQDRAGGRTQITITFVTKPK